MGGGGGFAWAGTSEEWWSGRGFGCFAGELLMLKVMITAVVEPLVGFDGERMKKDMGNSWVMRVRFPLWLVEHWG